MTTLAEKIAVLDKLIEEFRWARPQPETEEHRTYEVLKAIASDLRGRVNGAPSVAEHMLGQRLAAVQKAKARGDNLTGALMGLGQETVGRWATVQLALARLNTVPEEER